MAVGDDSGSDHDGDHSKSSEDSVDKMKLDRPTASSVITFPSIR